MDISALIPEDRMVLGSKFMYDLDVITHPQVLRSSHLTKGRSQSVGINEPKLVPLTRVLRQAQQTFNKNNFCISVRNYFFLTKTRGFMSSIFYVFAALAIHYLETHNAHLMYTCPYLYIEMLLI